ncbi:hypothetical protein C8Q80DRAFT_670671 [Daedaleopsis nitida]|nr:hypothetical protein C8Q80DRAFT_670671 [Daedaleopsis nitida]
MVRRGLSRTVLSNLLALLRFPSGHTLLRISVALKPCHRDALRDCGHDHGRCDDYMYGDACVHRRSQSPSHRHSSLMTMTRQTDEACGICRVLCARQRCERTEVATWMHP